MFKSIYRRMGECVHKPYAELILAVLFYFEALLLFLPTDPMLIVYCIERRNKAYWYALIATIASVLGGATGYLIGYWLWESYGQLIIHSRLVSMVLSPEDFSYLCGLYNKHEYLAIFIAGFTPVPYKAATFTAGFCKLGFIPFVVCSFFARGARFFLYAVVISIWGEKIKEYLDRYFNLLVVLILLLISVSIWLCKQ